MPSSCPYCTRAAACADSRDGTGFLELLLLLAGASCSVLFNSTASPSPAAFPHPCSITPSKTAGLEISGFLFNSQFKPQPRLRAPSFKETTPPVSAAVSAGKVSYFLDALAGRYWLLVDETVRLLQGVDPARVGSSVSRQLARCKASCITRLDRVACCCERPASSRPLPQCRQRCQWARWASC